MTRITYRKCKSCGEAQRVAAYRNFICVECGHLTKQNHPSLAA